ncbi:DUF1918 domain-containing protein [Nocardioides sp. YIM 152315]|uniref:DUF1918 domain-containing protein n=1 Tax=Nocardioides sp. YIM 152315 TaxID=3031760 RepID=UPI0023D983F1|nr:DUF1918 domain-containing protein [Nocardioides sp. YIM 152315]MDF1605672.1 DUF1918 domain-containing protein [Nocardioides sp. YIM 152315]
MRASVGDRLIVEAPTDHSSGRAGVVVEVRGDDGQPPYVVQWDDGHEGLCYPGPDAHVKHD